MTAAGASTVLIGKTVNQKLLDGMLGFASGVMIAASFFSLLAPAIELADGGPVPKWVPAVTGFLFGGGFLYAIDKLLPHLHPGSDQPEGVKTPWQRSVLLVLAITLHNIPEGLAVAMPLRKENVSKWKAFNLGQLSGIVEPIAAVVGVWAVSMMEGLLPYALAFAAGAMIYVVAEELIPEAKRSAEGSHSDIPTIGVMVGFAVMMLLDVALG